MVNNGPYHAILTHGILVRDFYSEFFNVGYSTNVRETSLPYYFIHSLEREEIDSCFSQGDYAKP